MAKRLSWPANLLLAGTFFLFCPAGAAHANWWSVLKSAGSTASGRVIAESAEAVLRGRPGSGVLTISEGDKLALVTLAASGVATVTYSSFDELVAGVKAVADDIFIPDEILTSQNGLVSVHPKTLTD